MKELEECNWKSFWLDAEILSVKATASSIDKGKLNGIKGQYPYITRTDCDNGYDCFVSFQDGYGYDEGNVITIGLDTQTVFYQPTTFYTGQNIQVLRNIQLNKYIAMFLIPLIKKQMKKFNWGGNGATLGRLKRLRIMLPVNSKDEPDYAFMEEYMREVEKRQKEKYKAHIQKKIEELGDVGNLEDKEWKAFALKNIFDEIQRGKRLKTDDHVVGSMPYVSSSSIDNGVDNFIGNEDDVRIFEDCITLANSGSVGTAFYQPFKFVASDHVTKLKQASFSKHVYLFIANQVSKLGEKYSFNREINDKRLGREYIMLPINSDGEPDYVFMESYMKRKEMEMLKRYVERMER
ncbi:MAG: restriction endonuclease subunit S [Bacteroidales bacterium]|nr:restriction endonuclease subunit S [Bacteroidales bacterium]